MDAGRRCAPVDLFDERIADYCFLGGGGGSGATSGGSDGGTSAGGQCVDDWLLDAGDLVSLEYSNRQAAYIGDTVTSGGRISAIDAATRELTIDLFIRNAAGEVITPGTAVVRFKGAAR